MSKIDDLIKKLCPNGVKYRKIGECCKIETGKLNASAAVESGDYMFFTTAKEASRTDTYRWDEEALLIAGNANVGDVKHYKGKFNAYQRTYVLTNFVKDINVRYLYFSLSNNLKVYLDSHKNEAAMTYIVLSTLENFEVAVPPLEVQCEIVHILDDFTLLSAELSAELKARKKQYQVYLELLLDKNNMTNFNIFKMSELFDFRNGLSKGKDSFGKGTPFIRYTDVYNNRFLKKDNITQLVTCNDVELKKLKVNRGDVLFTRTSEVAEEVGFSSVMLDNIENCVFNGFTIKASPKTSLLLPEYCAYCFSTNDFRNYVSTHCAFTTRASLTGKTIGEYEIVVPSINEQRRIVSILDKFYKICNDLSEGLPAEIEKRQKQYEYYRDKLLSFKEVEENV